MKIKYRPEIDGLRAVAVIAVIFYHSKDLIFDHDLFRGGFIGVDIFFVISGYLITSIIYNELITTGSFSFKYFYERRIRRILPALLFIIIIIFPFAWLYLLPSNFLDFLKSLIYSLGFSSNIYFHYSGQEYAAKSALFKPLLHTWSLSLEEQFYILFPIILLFAYRFFRNYLKLFLFSGFLISFALAEWGNKNYVSFTFYFIHSRMWELFAGSILAYFEISSGQRSNNIILNKFLPSVGILLIIHSIFFFHDQMFHPSFYTISPIIGVCLIIWFSNEKEIITKILSSKLFVGIGLISYSLYLWHYPIFAFQRTINLFQPNFYIFLFLIIIFVSIFSYYFIEKPARNKSNRFKYILVALSTLYLILIFSAFYFLSGNSLNLKNNINLFNQLQQSKGEFNELENTRDYWENCEAQKIEDNNFCTIGDYEKKIYIIGDSHLIPLVRDLGKKLNKKNYELVYLIQSSFPYRRKLQEDKRVNFLKNIKESIFIFGGYYQRESEEDLNLIYDNYKQDFNIFHKNNNHIIFLSPIPEIEFKPEIQLYQIKKNILKDISTDKAYVEIRNKPTLEFIKKFKDIHLIDLKKVFCNELKCYAVTPNKIILKSDYDHPSLEGAKMINNLIITEIEKIETKFKKDN